MFDFLNNCIVVACDNYFRTVVNVPLKQQLCCNYCTMYIQVIMPCVHIFTTHYVATDFLLQLPLTQLVKPLMHHY